MKNRNWNKLFSGLLALIMVLSMIPTAVFAAEGDAYQLVTDVADLKVGDQVVIAAKDLDYAMGTTQNGNNRASASLTKDGDTVVPGADIQVLTLEEGTKEGTFALYTGDGYLYAASSSKNYLRTQAEKDDNASWSIEIAADGNATVKSQGEYTRNWMRFNSGNNPPLFACYGSGQADIAIYKLPAVEETGHVVINQVYGGGGNSGAEYKNDFIELYNPTGKEIDLSGWSVQYAAKTGTSWQITPLAGTIPAHGYYLIQEAAGNGGTKDLPTPDDMGNIAMGAKELKVALVNGVDAITGKSDEKVVDFVGVGGADEYEGTAAAKILSNTTAALRAVDGVDTDDNAADFIVGAPNPRNSSEAVDPSEPSVPTDPSEPSDGLFQDGEEVVIYNPGSGMAMSAEAVATYYRAGVPVTPNDDGTVAATPDLIWTVNVNGDGSYTFSNAGRKLSMGESFASIPFDDVNTAWNVETALTEGCHYMVNAARGSYIEWYADKNEFSTYKYSQASEAIFALRFLKPVTEPEAPEAGLPEEGSQVVIYNVSSKGVLALQEDGESPSILNAEATLADGKAVAANGAVVFTVEKNGEYYRFRNETFGYLCSNGTGSNAFYSLEASEDADWKLDALGGGYRMMSRTAKYNGTAAQYLEYYSGSYKTYSYYATNKDGTPADTTIYQFQFLPCGNEASAVVGGVVNQPKVEFNALPAYTGQDYSFSFTVDAVFGVDTLEVKLGETVLTASLADGVYTVAVPAELVTGEKLVVTVSGQDTKGVAISGAAEIEVKDEPVVSNLLPAPGFQTKEEKRPTISADIANAGEAPVVTMTVNGKEVKADYLGGKVTYTPDADLEEGKTTVTVTVKRADGKEVSKSWTFTVGENRWQLYYGQLHAHTAEYSDGAGTLQSALDYIAGLPESANVDFVAFTDHSNYFDTTAAPNPESALYDTSAATPESLAKWNKYKSTVAAFNEKHNDVLALGAFEMTWSGGPGHMNTFNTPGVVSRNNKTLNNKTGDAGMKAYYELLSNPALADSISQFNHPGKTFGTFADFAYWDAVIDNRITLVEVGNGEGQIGAGGYFPSYEYYTMALDKGWHVAPTNNQDNHKGKWGNANDARDVILTDNFTEEGIYEAMKAMRMYATEDKNLALTYTLNDYAMGSSIEEVPEQLNIAVTVRDPDASDSISKVEVIVNSGKVAYTWSDPKELATGNLQVTLDPTYSYYYIRVTQGDGDLAVTAPVWVGESLKLGISDVVCGTATPVTNEELVLSTTLFNSESSAATVKSLTYTVNGSQVIGTDTTGYELPASGNLTVDFKYTPTTAKVMEIVVTAVVEQDGEEFTFTKSITLDVEDADKLVYIGIDASHYNEYVAGNYKDSMGNFGALAAGYAVRTVELKTSEDLIAACGNEKYKMLILTAPSRRNGSALRDPYKCYSDEEIQALVDFNKAGGALVLAGWSDYYESYSPFAAGDHMAAQQNKILAALGSSLRITDDATNDDKLNGGQSQRLYFSSYNFDSFLMEGVDFDSENPNNNLYSQLFSQYGGASIHAVDAAGNLVSTLPDTVTPVVFGHESTYSTDSDNDGIGGDSVPKYAFGDSSRLLVLATEELPGQGLIVVSGAAFMSNFEVQATIGDSGAEKNYSNYNICENLISRIHPIQVSPIADVQAETDEGVKFTIEGVITSNASGYDKDTAFFDCIYLQDETAGINAFPVAGNFKIGDRVRITGTTSSYQGERQIAVKSITLIEEVTPIVPAVITAEELNSGSVLGSLVTLKGTVQEIILKDGIPENILVKDENGNVGRVFIDGYITKDLTIENLVVGNEITATGLASYDNTYNDPDGPFARIRVRNRAEVVCSENHTHVYTWVVTKEATCTEDGLRTGTCPCGDTVTETIPATGHKFGEWTVTKEATCTEDGEETRVCETCGTKESRKVEALGHKFGEWTVTKEATCTEDGEETRVCETCGTKESRKVEALGHKFGEWTVTKEATCTEKGEETRACERCHEKETRETEALGHDFGAWKTVKKPTLEEEGLEERVCKRCGEKETRKIPALEPPKTGDTTPIILWILLLVVSAAAVTTLVILRKRENDK